MLVLVKRSCRIDRPRAVGSPGFQDIVAGQVLRILETDFNCFFYETVTEEGGMTEEEDNSPLKG